MKHTLTTTDDDSLNNCTVRAKHALLYCFYTACAHDNKVPMFNTMENYRANSSARKPTRLQAYSLY